VKTMAKVTVPCSAVWDSNGGKENKKFAVYKIEVEERGAVTTSTWRRWNDLKMAVESLERSHVSEMASLRASGKLPKFEPHGWRVGNAALDEAFLDERRLSMQSLLQAFVDGFDVSLSRQTGPSELRKLLDPNGQPSTRSTVSGDEMANFFRAQSPSSPMETLHENGPGSPLKGPGSPLKSSSTALAPAETCPPAFRLVLFGFLMVVAGLGLAFTQKIPESLPGVASSLVAEAVVNSTPATGAAVLLLLTIGVALLKPEVRAWASGTARRSANVELSSIELM